MATKGLQRPAESRADRLLKCAVSCDGPVEDADTRGRKRAVFLQDTRNSDNALRRMLKHPEH